MVVAQIPLWILHSTFNGGGGPGGNLISGSNNSNSQLPALGPSTTASSTSSSGAVVGAAVGAAAAATDGVEPDGAGGGGGGDDGGVGGKKKNDKVAAQSQLNLWATNSSNSNRRSAIYCCDISLGRIATGGGDGKIRLWSLACLFHSSKCDLSSNEPTASGGSENENENDNNNVNGSSGKDGGGGGKSKKNMAMFRNGGGYDSSDSSASSSSDRTSVDNNPATDAGDNATSNGITGGNVSNNDIPSILEETKQNDISNGNRTTTTTTDDRVHNTINIRNSPILKNSNQSSTSTSTSTSDTKTSTPNIATTTTTTTTTTPSGKKRKRAALLSSVPQDFPKAPPAPPLTHIPTSPKRRILCTLASHSGSVLALRFSPSGTYLASAGDDAHVLIYTRCSKPSVLTYGNLLNNNNNTSANHHHPSYPPSSSSNNYHNTTNNDSTTPEEKDVEHWNRIRILRGHNLDVVGLAWAPDDSHLVSCSLDSATPICVWRLDFDEHHPTRTNDNAATDTPTYNNRRPHDLSNPILHPYKILGRDVHTSTVKGVAFDPAGKYVASSGDDPAVCIWRAFDDWGLEERIDSSAGIFHSKATSGTTGAAGGANPKKGAVGAGAGGNGNGNGGAGADEENRDHDEMEEEEDVQALASLSLFRRISFAPDGTHVCGTNATLRGKNIAAMISREGWGVSSTPQHTNTGGGGRRRKSSSGGGGAANLVGHKQPVVSSRHCPYFFEVSGNKAGANGKKNHGQSSDREEDDEDVEPNYSTLLALGDKKGFVTIWSTKKCKPIFKLQCSESRCTVTDISWGLIPSSSSQSTTSSEPQPSQSLALVISLLDGYVVALCFQTPGEVGTILSNEKRDRIFRLKYGINLGSSDGAGLGFGGMGSPSTQRRRLVDDKSGPKLIENMLQYAMEDDADRRQQQHQANTSEGGDSFSNSSDEEGGGGGNQFGDDNDDAASDNEKQRKSMLLLGKKRVQPVLMPISNGAGGKGAMLEERIVTSEAHHTSNTFKNAPAGGVSRNGDNNSRRKSVSKLRKKENAVSDALQSAEKAASAAEGVSVKSTKRDDSKIGGATGIQGSTENETSGQQNKREQAKMARPLVGEAGGIHTVISPGSSQTIYTVNLTADIRLKDTDIDQNTRMPSEKVVASCTNSIQKLPGFNGSFPCATLSISCGGKVTWKDQIVGAHCTTLASTSSLMIVGTNDGTIYVYGTSPSLGWKSGIGFRSHPPFIMGTSVVRLTLRQTISEKIDNGIVQCEMLVVMADGSFGVYKMMPSPNLSYKGSLLAPMNQMRISSRKSSQQVDLSAIPFPKLARIQLTESNHLLLILSQPPSISGSTVGGMLQGFLYNRDMELWMRVSDNRFMFSTFYSTIPCTKLAHGLLSKLDRTIQAQTPRRGIMSETSAAGIYQNNNEEDDLNSIFTRSHCEDRIACALALRSSSDFRYWLSQYIRRLASEGNQTHLRFVVDMLLDKVTQTGNVNAPSQCEEGTGNYLACWWLSSAKSVLGLNRREAVQQVVIPEMSKNRALQRLMNEIATEINVV